MEECAGLLKCVASIVSAYISRGDTNVDDVEKFMEYVYLKLKTLDKAIVKKRELVAAVPIEKSVLPDYIICLEDGKKLKMLKRHLRTVYNMSIDDYKAKWGLPPDYPSVAKNYAEKRSMLAKAIGLGKKPGGGKASPGGPKVTLRVV